MTLTLRQLSRSFLCMRGPAIGVVLASLLALIPHGAGAQSAWDQLKEQAKKAKQQLKPGTQPATQPAAQPGQPGRPAGSAQQPAKPGARPGQLPALASTAPAPLLPRLERKSSLC